MHRLVVKYDGRVQGVGFRITVVELAEGLDVVGTVSNASDGSVRLSVEGPQDELLELSSRIRQRFARNIVAESPAWTEIASLTATSLGVGPDLAR